MNNLTKEYWDNRYATNQTGWEMGAVSPPLKAYFDQLTDTELHILIPGAGNAYEAEYLFNMGFKNIHVVDISSEAIKLFKERVPDFPSDHIHLQDFFDHEASYDLIIEQTFFCALDPKLRKNYAVKMFDLLKKGGKLTGLLFSFPLTDAGPPFGGSIEEYNSLFSNTFEILRLEPCYNSIPPRQGNELFFQLQKSK